MTNCRTMSFGLCITVIHTFQCDLWLNLAVVRRPDALLEKAECEELTEELLQLSTIGYCQQPVLGHFVWFQCQYDSQHDSRCAISRKFIIDQIKKFRL